MMRFIFSYLLILSAIFSFLIPPFQKPDETVHFKKTLSVSYGIFDCPKNGKIRISKQFADLLAKKDLQQMISKKNYKIKFSDWFSQVIATPATGNHQSTIAINQSVCQLPTISYLPQVLGILISRFLNFNQYLSFFFGRFIGFLIFFAWFYLLLKKAPKSTKNIFLLTFCLPMTVHQLTSYSYDGVQIMLSLTAFLALIKIVESKYKKIGWLLIFALSAMFFLLSRKIVKVAYPPKVNPDGQLDLLYENPFLLLKVVLATSFYRFPFYFQGLIGIFGWLEYGLDYFSYFFYSLLIFFVIFQTSLEKKLLLSKLQDIFLAGMIFTYYIFLILINYLFWTPYGLVVAEGVQGRYFIFVFPFFIYLMINIRQIYCQQPKFKKIFLRTWIAAFFFVGILTLIFQAVIFRFYLI